MTEFEAATLYLEALALYLAMPGELHLRVLMRVEYATDSAIRNLERQKASGQPPPRWVRRL